MYLFLLLICYWLNNLVRELGLRIQLKISVLHSFLRLHVFVPQIYYSLLLGRKSARWFFDYLLSFSSRVAAARILGLLLFITWVGILAVKSGWHAVMERVSHLCPSLVLKRLLAAAASEQSHLVHKYHWFFELSLLYLMLVVLILWRILGHSSGFFLLILLVTCKKN